MRARVALGLVTTSLVGCSSCSSGSSPGGTTPPGEQAPAGGAGYEVHEWGLIRAQLVGGTEILRVGAVPPERPVEVMAVDKPVLYFHTSAPLTLERVTVRAPGARVLETWPYVEGGEEIAWRDVALDPSGQCTPSPLPGATSPPCLLLGAASFCEAAGLAVVRTSDAACVRVGETTDRFLFYRAQSGTFTPPLRFARTEVFEDVRVTNDGDEPIPGVIVRLWSDGTRTRTLVAAPPAPHQSLVIGHAFEADGDDVVDRPVDPRSVDETPPAPTVTGPGRDAIRRTMREIGLTDPEVDAFLAAWDGTLFGGERASAAPSTDMPVDVLTDDSRSMDGDPAPRESLLYFLPAPSAQQVATLSFDPPPRAVHRAMAIWTAIRASGEGR